ncbi:MAG: Cna B-type domain-containing protein [Firmicutes bacterium]|nr:Cna B-type domain-containing protein [Bacillota bacterium]
MINSIFTGVKLFRIIVIALIVAVLMNLALLSAFQPAMAADDGIPGLKEASPGSVFTIDGIEWVVVKNQYMTGSMKTATLLLLNDVIYPNTNGIVYATTANEWGGGNWLNNRVQQLMDGWYTSLNSPTLKQWALKPILGGSPNPSWVNNLSQLPLAGNVTTQIAFLPRKADVFPSLSTSQLILFNPQNPASTLKEWWTSTISTAAYGCLEILKTSGTWSYTTYDASILYGSGAGSGIYARPAIWVASSSQYTSISPYVTLTLNANGGSGTLPTQTVSRNSYAQISSIAPSHASATFLGWALSSTATTPMYQSSDFIYMDNDKTLFAVWSSAGGLADDNTGLLGLREKTPGSIVTIDGIEWVLVKSQYMSSSMKTIYLLLLNDVLYPNTGGLVYATSLSEWGGGNWLNNRVQQQMDGWYAALNAPTLKKWALKPMLGGSPNETWVNNLSQLPMAGNDFYQIAYLPRKADLFPSLSTSQLILFKPQNPASTLKEWWTSTFSTAAYGCLEILRTSGTWSYTTYDASILYGSGAGSGIYARPAIWVVGSNASTPVIPTTATIIVEHKDANSGAILGQANYVVNAGNYGPYNAISFAGYGTGALAPGSALGTGTIAGGQTITITYLYTAIVQQVKINVGGTVNWNDGNNSWGTRPANVTVGLFRNGQPLQMQQVSSFGNGQYLFSNLDKYAPDGSEYIYTVNEQAVSGYKITINGYNILNTLIM